MAKKNAEEKDLIYKSPRELDGEHEEKIKEFTDLLGTLSTLDEKRKSLWKNIFENAVLDRRNAYIMFSDLYQKVHGKGEQHALHGSILAKYMERLNKSNEQLIKLAALVDHAITVEEEGSFNENEIYERLGELNNNAGTNVKGRK